MADLTWLQSEYGARKAEAESRVADWQAYTNEGYSAEPLYFEVHHYRRGRRLASPGDPEARWWHGVDDSGRVWVDRQATEYPGRVSERFYVVGADGPTQFALYDYSDEKRALRHEVFTYEDGRLVASQYAAEHGAGASRYLYGGDRLVRIESRLGPSPEALRPHTRTDVSYDDLGRLQEIWLSWERRDGTAHEAELLYRSTHAGVTTRSLERIFLDRLAEAAPLAVAGNPPAGPAYCLAVVYDPGEYDSLPPALALGVGERPEDARRPLDPEPMHRVPIDRRRFPELARAGGMLDQVTADSHQLRALMNAAADRLAAHEWARTIRVSDGFFVYATDLAQVDLEANLRRSVGADRARALLAAAGRARPSSGQGR
jgi:hypothetical protein